MTNNNEKNTKVVVAKKKILTEERKEAAKGLLKALGVSFLCGGASVLGALATNRMISGVKSHVVRNK